MWTVQSQVSVALLMPRYLALLIASNVSLATALDGVFMSFYMLISLSIIAALLSVKFRTAALSMGAVLLGCELLHAD